MEMTRQGFLWFLYFRQIFSITQLDLNLHFNLVKYYTCSIVMYGIDMILNSCYDEQTRSFSTLVLLENVKNPVNFNMEILRKMGCEWQLFHKIKIKNCISDHVLRNRIIYHNSLAKDNWREMGNWKKKAVLTMDIRNWIELSFEHLVRAVQDGMFCYIDCQTTNHT